LDRQLSSKDVHLAVNFRPSIGRPEKFRLVVTGMIPYDNPNHDNDDYLESRRKDCVKSSIPKTKKSQSISLGSAMIEV
jgi:hypothetical protein